jgi:3-phosphoshikimate 1-carboxyvinyltransferase
VEEGGLRIEGRGLEGLSEAEDVLDCGNSGTTMRLLAGLLAGFPHFTVLSGDGSLRSRPMRRVAEPLRLMGARVDGREQGTRAPLAIRGGGLQGIDYRLPVASAQVKSALLLAGLRARGETVVREPLPSRDHTERMLAAMGAGISLERGRITITPGFRLRPLDLRVPGDFSSAAFWLVAATVVPGSQLGVRGVGVNPTRTGLLAVLDRMGAEIRLHQRRQVQGEPVADLVAGSSRLRAARVEAPEIPGLIDELPVLAVAMALAEGTSEVRGASELRVKETDRIRTVCEGLRALGADIEERQDGFVIRGGRPLRGARVSSQGDHRLAMALAVAGLAAEGETVIEGAEAVEVSYPAFWQHLQELRV